MNAVVVYESLWGNTAAIARAIAQGLGSGARVFSTAEASNAALAGVDLLVVGSPVLGFRAPTQGMIQSIAHNPMEVSSSPDLTQPAMQTWLAELEQGHGLGAAYETRIWWSPGGATGAILRGLEQAGYRTLGKGQRFIVKDKHGPLREGELERAAAWGAELARQVQQPA